MKEKCKLKQQGMVRYNFFVFLFSFFPFYSFSQKTITTSFYLPDHIKSGLYYNAFEITPTFQADVYTDRRELTLLLKITPLTGQNYEYQYRYKGKLYTDKMVGGDVFTSIKISSVTFDITVQGPGVNLSTTYSKGDGQTWLKENGKQVNLPGTAKPSDYFVTITGIRNLSFEGTGPIINRIEALLAKEKSQTEAAERLKNEAGKKEEDKQAAVKKQQEEKKPDEANTGAQNKNLKNETTTQGTGNSLVTGNPEAEKPEFRVDNMGRYYQKDANNNYHEISYDDYHRIKHEQSQQQTKKGSNIDYAADTRKKLQESNESYWAEKERSDRMIEEKTTSLVKSFYAAQAIKESKENMSKLTKLDGNYSSVEELEADFSRKYQAINREVENLNHARNEGFQSLANATFSGSGENGQAAAQVLGGIASNINDARAEREKKEAKEALERAREKKQVEVEAKMKALKLKMRKSFLDQFPDGGIPVSSHNVNTNQLFYFAYITEQNSLDQDFPVIRTTNVFPVNRYEDGTWPLKHILMNDLQKLGKGTVTLMGYYTTEQLAKEMHASFLSLSEKCEFINYRVNYKVKKPSEGTTDTDFWGNDQKKDTLQNKKVSKPKDDFWDN